MNPIDPYEEEDFAIRRMCDENALIRSRIKELKQQVANLEEYMLKGVAFRDELQAKLAANDAEAKRLRDRLSQTVPRELYDKLRDDIVAAKEG